jgi:hypothetical protein
VLFSDIAAGPGEIHALFTIYKKIGKDNDNYHHFNDIKKYLHGVN